MVLTQNSVSECSEVLDRANLTELKLGRMITSVRSLANEIEVNAWDDDNEDSIASLVIANISIANNLREIIESTLAKTGKE